MSSCLPAFYSRLFLDFHTQDRDAGVSWGRRFPGQVALCSAGMSGTVGPYELKHIIITEMEDTLLKKIHVNVTTLDHSGNHLTH